MLNIRRGPYALPGCSERKTNTRERGKKMQKSSSVSRGKPEQNFRRARVTFFSQVGNQTSARPSLPAVLFACLRAGAPVAPVVRTHTAGRRGTESFRTANLLCHASSVSNALLSDAMEIRTTLATMKPGQMRTQESGRTQSRPITGPHFSDASGGACTMSVVAWVQRRMMASCARTFCAMCCTDTPPRVREASIGTSTPPSHFVFKAHSRGEGAACTSTR